MQHNAVNAWLKWYVATLLKLSSDYLKPSAHLNDVKMGLQC